MGAHSTSMITRADAKKQLLLKMMDIAENKVSDEILIRLMEVFYDHSLDNFLMVDEYNDDNRPHWYVR